MKPRPRSFSLASKAFALMLSLATALFVALPSWAQSAHRGSVPSPVRKVTAHLGASTPSCSQAVKVPPHFKFGRMVSPSSGRQPMIAFPQSAPRGEERLRVPFRVPVKSTFYANAVSSTYMGLMSYSIASPIDVQTYTQFDRSVFNGGSTIKDGKLCGLYLDTSMQSYGLVFIWYGWFDLETGEYDGDLNTLHDTRLVALANATDPNTGEVFGEFYDSSMQGMEFGVVDYEKHTRTKIATATHLYVAMGIASDGDAYGITSQGDLYQINRTDGTESLIGSTGINPTGADGTFFNQSGVIDPKTDTFYWASTDGNMDCAVYAVDLNDASVTKVSDSPYQQVALNVVPPAAEDKAPAVVENLRVSFEGPSTSGSVSFTMPTKTFDTDSQLAGQLGYQVSVNGTSASTGTANPGEQVTVRLSGVAQGMDQFAVIATNSVGKSPVQALSRYVGYDQPLPPTHVQLVANGSTGVLTWDAPTGTVHEGYMGDLTYNVYRVQDGQQTLVRDGLTARTSSFEIDRVGALQNYTYSVEAVNHGQMSERARSNGVVVGQALDVPFFDDFNENIDLYTVIDANRDGCTWSWEDYRQAARYSYSEENDADDWLISPPINLKGGRNYVVSYKASSASTRFSEQIEAKWGMAPTVAGMTWQLTPQTQLLSNEYTTFEQTVTPSTDGVYYFGIHATSFAGSFYTYVDSLSVREGADPASPGAVTNLKATPDQTGELSVTLTFNLPTLTVNGEALGEVAKVEVLKGEGNVIWASDGALAPGQEMSVVDANAVEGTNSYTIVTYNSAGKGLSADVSAVAGLDLPNPPVVTPVDQQTSVKLTWGDITGVNGGVINQKDVSVWIYSMTDENTFGSLIGRVAGGSRDYTVGDMHTDEGMQQYDWWSLRAYNTKGGSTWGKAKLLVGTPYGLPYTQSFSNGTAGGRFVGFESENRNMQIGFVTIQSADFDGGAVAFTSSEAAVGNVVLGKVKLPEGKSSVMGFSYKSASPVPMKLSVVARLPDGTESEPLWSADLSASASADWQTASFVLPASLAANRYVVPCIRAEVTAPMPSSQTVLVDNVKILEPALRDAAVSVAVPRSLNKGQTAPLRVTVSNEGLEDLSGATVTLKVDGETVDERAINGRLSTTQTTGYTVDYRTSSLNEKGSLTVEATVTLDGDGNADNDVATATISCRDAQVAAPTDLTGVGPRPVHLSWNAPEGSGQETVTDDFERYAAWATDAFGEWTTVKVDNGVAAGITSAATLPGQGTAYAFINWQPSDYFRTGQGLDPHSGMRCLAAFYQLTSDQTDVVDADAWLISPRLSGRAQTVSFWVNNLSDETGTYGRENYEVYYSTGGLQTSDFIKVGGTRTQGSTAWTQVSVDLPEGARYFAVRHCTPATSALCFMLDDVTFQRNVGADSYNVYRDGKLLANVVGLGYRDDAAPEGEHVYQVTAVYADGSESAPISTTVLTDIRTLERSGAACFDVYTPDGKLVRRHARRLGDLRPGVYVVNGKKVILR